MEFCRKMIYKKDKEEKYVDLEQPQGVPDVKPISKEELDDKIKEVLIEPKEAQTIGENTIPPQYSREMSRYEPPLPVKEKEKEEVLEKVREITNGGSKGSKDEKQVEGETELSWDHEGLEPYPGPEKPKPQRSPKGSKTLVENDKKRPSLEASSRDKGDHDERGEYSKRIREEFTSPRVNGVNPREEKKELPSKWDFQEGKTVIDGDTEQWVNEQNKFWKRKQGKGKRKTKRGCIQKI